MSEFAPGWSQVRMTKSQIRKYIRNMQETQKSAKKKLLEAEASWEFDKDKQELKALEKKLDDL